ARLQPRPAREHARGGARREARRLPRQPAAAGPAGDPRGGRAGQPWPRRERDPEGEGPARSLDELMRPRYRWVVLAAGTFSQASFSCTTIGLPALSVALRAHYGLTLSETGVVLAGTGIGMLFTLLPWGLLADRLDERWVIAVGLVGCGATLAGAATTHTYLAITLTLV